MEFRTRKPVYKLFFTFVSFFIVCMAQIFNFAQATGFSDFGQVRFNGITTGIIRDIVTIDGEIYLGAENGLFSVVGASTAVYDYRNSLLGNGVISDIKKSNDGGLWIVEYGGGVYHFDPSRLAFSHAVIDHPKLKYSWSIEETTSHLVVSTISGLLVIDKASKKVINEIDSHNGKELEGVYSLTKGPNDRVYLASENVLYTLNSDLELNKFKLTDSSNSLAKLSEISLFQFIGKNTYVAGPEGIYIVSGSDVRFTPVSAGIKLPYGVEVIFQDSNNNLWIAGGGLFRLDPDKNEIVRPEFLQPHLSSAAIESITSISETANGELILGSSQSGLIVVPSFSKSLNYLAVEGSPFVENIKDIKLIGKDVWIKTPEQTYKLDPLTGNVIKTPLHPRRYDCVAALSEVDVDRISMISAEGGSCTADSLRTFTSQKRTWIYSRHGEKRDILEVKKGQIVDIYEAPGEVINVVVTDKNDLLVATKSGKLFIQHSRATWKEIPLPTLSSLQITCLLNGVNDTVWICTSGEGVLNLKLTSYEISPVTSEELGAAKFIRGGARITNSKILLTTNRGVFVFDEKSESAQSISASDGVVDVDFEYSGVYETSEATIVIVGDRYSYLFDKQKLIEALAYKQSRRSSVELLEITGVRGSDEPFLLGASLDEGKSQVHTRRLIDRLIIKLSSSNYTARSDLRVEYRMLGVFSEWRELEQSKGAVIIEPVESGRYEFQVRVVDPHSSAPQSITTLPVNVEPPLFLSWTAYYTYALILFAIAYFFRHKYIHRLSKIVVKALEKNGRKKEDLSEKLKKLKTTIVKKQKMFSDISHEMKSPVMLIRGPLKDIRDNPKDDKANRKRIEVALNQADKLQCLINQIIQIEYLESVTKLPRKPIQIKECIEGLGIQLQAVTEVRSQVLDVNVSGDAVLTLIEDSLEKIITNLVANASKYSDERTLIKVRVGVDEEMVTIRVIDEGIGINAKDFESVFQRFNQLKTVDEEGSGIGLAMVRELARANGGNVELRSKEGEGSTFTVTLPVTCSEIPICTGIEWVPVGDSHEMDGEETTDEQHGTEQDKPIILIVEDCRDMRFYLCNVFEPEYTCVTARNGQHALDVLQVYQPDLIISDLEMPELNGVALARHLQQSDSQNMIPFIMLTAHEDKELRSAAWEQGIEDYILKPFSSDELLIKVRNILNNRSKFSDYLEQNQSKPPLQEVKSVPQFSSRKDMEFHTNFLAVVEKNYHNEKWGRADAAGLLLVSERQLNRKVSDLFGSSFTEYLRNHRLTKAGERLANGEQITHVAYGVGFGTPSYFSSCFKQKYGKSPKGYQEDAIEKSPVTG